MTELAFVLIWIAGLCTVWLYIGLLFKSLFDAVVPMFALIFTLLEIGAF